MKGNLPHQLGNLLFEKAGLHRKSDFLSVYKFIFLDKMQLIVVFVYYNIK